MSARRPLVRAGRVLQVRLDSVQPLGGGVDGGPAAVSVVDCTRGVAVLMVTDRSVASKCRCDSMLTPDVGDVVHFDHDRAHARRIAQVAQLLRTTIRRHSHDVTIDGTYVHAHPMCTTRMSDHPGRGCRPRPAGRRHRLRVRVYGSSSFTTGAAAHPTADGRGAGSPPRRGSERRDARSRPPNACVMTSSQNGQFRNRSPHPQSWLSIAARPQM